MELYMTGVAWLLDTFSSEERKLLVASTSKASCQTLNMQ